ncbi:MAG: ATP-binding protein, partial [Longimicrobiales bacterium]|nr:ATP-binding protein [Longimicrobiales bacterium]
VQYLMGRWQGDAEWFKREVGQPMSLKELLALGQKHMPAESKAVLDMVLDALRQPDPREYERRELKQRAMRDFDIGYGWDLPSGVVQADPREPDPLDAFELDGKYPTLAQAKEAVLAWCARTGPPLLTLAGASGVGKTHLAYAAASRVVGLSEPVLFRREADLLAEFQGGVRTGETEELIRAYAAVPWLVLDDFGAVATTDWSRSVEDRLVDARWQGARAGLRTLVTTNMGPKQLPMRAASRLSDVSLGVVVAISAPDHRKRGPRGWR